MGPFHEKKICRNILGGKKASGLKSKRPPYYDNFYLVLKWFRVWHSVYPLKRKSNPVGHVYNPKIASTEGESGHSYY